LLENKFTAFLFFWKTARVENQTKFTYLKLWQFLRKRHLTPKETNAEPRGGIRQQSKPKKLSA
jgi:hypothetical protein